IRIPVGWLRQQPEPARVSAVTGHAQVRAASTGNLRPLSRDDLVRAGDTIITRAGSVMVELADGSSIRVEPDSSVAFNRLTRYGRNGMTDTRVRLERGELSNRVRPMIEEGARFEVETPSAVAAVRGTAFALQADRRGTHLQVTEGSVAFGRPGATRDIPAGFGASVSRSGNGDLQIRRLPPAPQPDQLPGGTITSLPGQLSWQADGARRYQVDVIEEDTGYWVRREQTSDHRIDLDDLANGKYRVEIAALSSRGTQGMPASVTLEVDLAARAAELQEPAAGAAVDSDLPRFRWRQQGDSERARVEIARDEDFTDVVASSEWSKKESATSSRALRPGDYFWRVVTEAGGTSVATSDTRRLTVNGTLPPVRVISANYVDRQVRLFWESIDEASGYLLQLSEDPSFEEVIKEATVDDTTAALRLIPGRRYFVRLRAVSEGPLAGRWGPGRELYVE
ncbi:MAG: FecR domain-containing protein, partial [Marinobacter sp.]